MLFTWQEPIPVEDADLVVIIRSGSLLASDYLMGLVTSALSRRRVEGISVIPIHGRPSALADMELDGLLHLPGLDEASLVQASSPDEAWIKVVRALRDLTDHGELLRRRQVDLERIPGLPASVRGLALQQICLAPQQAAETLVRLADAARPEPSFLSELWASMALLPPDSIPRTEGRLREVMLSKAGVGAGVDPGKDLEWRQVTLGPRAFQATRHPITEAQVRRALPGLFSTAPAQADHPLVGHSLSEAALLSALLGAELPSYQEYLYMGWHDRGGRPRNLPWGDHPDPERSNCRERGLLGPCSVRVHEGLGTSAWGIEDLAGNVWEWTRPEPPYSAGGVPIIGGCYADPQRASMRGNVNEYAPSRSARSIGFRVVRDV